MEDIKFYTEEEALDMTLGPKGTKIRDDYERQMQEVHSGKYYTMKPDETLDEFLDRMEAEGVISSEDSK
jgi:hypothetical protein